jgi:hypothetical protein
MRRWRRIKDGTGLGESLLRGVGVESLEVLGLELGEFLAAFPEDELRFGIEAGLERVLDRRQMAIGCPTSVFGDLFLGGHVFSFPTQVHSNSGGGSTPKLRSLSL